jgi:hypothetical protein
MPPPFQQNKGDPWGEEPTLSGLAWARISRQEENASDARNLGSSSPQPPSPLPVSFQQDWHPQAGASTPIISPAEWWGDMATTQQSRSNGPPVRFGLPSSALHTGSDQSYFLPQGPLAGPFVRHPRLAFDLYPSQYQLGDPFGLTLSAQNQVPVQGDHLLDQCGSYEPTPQLTLPLHSSPAFYPQRSPSSYDDTGTGPCAQCPQVADSNAYQSDSSLQLRQFPALLPVQPSQTPTVVGERMDGIDHVEGSSRNRSIAPKPALLDGPSNKAGYFDQEGCPSYFHDPYQFECPPIVAFHPSVAYMNDGTLGYHFSMKCLHPFRGDDDAWQRFTQPRTVGGSSRREDPDERAYCRATEKRVESALLSPEELTELWSRAWQCAGRQMKFNEDGRLPATSHKVTVCGKALYIMEACLAHHLSRNASIMPAATFRQCKIRGFDSLRPAERLDTTVFLLPASQVTREQIDYLKSLPLDPMDPVPDLVVGSKQLPSYWSRNV